MIVGDRVIVISTGFFVDGIILEGDVGYVMELTKGGHPRIKLDKNSSSYWINKDRVRKI